MNNLVPLHFENADVRMVMRDGEPWWVLLDLCTVLGIKNHRDKANSLWTWQKDYVGISDAIGRVRKTIVVNEAGAYALILDSNKPDVERFAKWLFTDVLPSIRKHGCYPPPPQIELVPPPPAPRQDRTREPATATERLFAEFERVFGTGDWRKLVPILSHIVSKSRLIALKRGDGLLSALKHGNAWLPLVCAGIDLRYVFGNSWTFDPHERDHIDRLRALGEEGQAMALQSFTRQMNDLRANEDSGLQIPPSREG